MYPENGFAEYENDRLTAFASNDAVKPNATTNSLIKSLTVFGVVKSRPFIQLVASASNRVILSYASAVKASPLASTLLKSNVPIGT